MSKEHQQRLPIQSPLEELSYGMLGFIHERVDQFKKIWNPDVQQQVSSAHRNWDTTSYCRMLSQEARRQYSVPELLQTIAPNFETFTDEYSLGAIKKSYRYSNLKDDQGNIIGSSGVADSYREPMALQAERFQYRMNQAGRADQRATIETFNVQRLESWMSQVLTDKSIPVGTKLVWCSLPGHRYEGYQGVTSKHHSFVWVYEKKQDESGYYLEMTQFRCWPSLRQMQGIQNKLEKVEHSTGKLAPFPEVAQKLTARNGSIGRMIELPSTVSSDQIESTIYESERNWEQNRAGMPDTQLKARTKAQFAEQRTQVLKEFLLPIYEQVLKQGQTLEGLTQPYLHGYWSSPEYKHVIWQLDFCLAIAKQSLDKWIELALDEKLQGTLPAVDIEGLHTLYQLKIKSLSQQMTLDETNTFNMLAPRLLSLGNRALSWGQCGLGTVVPLNLVNKFQLTNGARAASGVAQLGKADLRNLTLKEKGQFKKEVLDNYRQFFVHDRNGKAHAFWVVKEHYHEYVGHCYQDEAGIFRGPCHVELSMETDEFILTDEKYQELLAEANSEELSKAEQLRQLQQKEHDELLHANNDIDRQRIRNKYKKLRQDVQDTYDVADAVSSFLLMYSTSFTSPFQEAA